jgi:hypothetical protein
MSNHRITALAAAMALTAAACNSITAPGPNGRQLGILEWQTTAAAALGSAGNEMQEQVLSAPDTVAAGVPFVATVTTIGASGCWQADGATTKMAAQQATITPYDFVRTHFSDGTPAVCTTALVSLPRTVTITFTTKGEATIRVEGRVVRNGDLTSTQPVAVEKSVIVR